MPSYKLVSEWVEEWRTSVHSSLVKRAFELCGIGTGEMQIMELNVPLRQLFSMEDEDDVDFDPEMFLDDEDAYEFDEDDNELSDDEGGSIDGDSLDGGERSEF